MRDRDGGAGGGFQVSGSGHLPASVAVWKDGFRTPWQARRAPPEAVLIGKRRDPPLPLTGNNRKRSHYQAMTGRHGLCLTRTATMPRGTCARRRWRKHRGGHALDDAVQVGTSQILP